jgi:hypothetical protein
MTGERITAFTTAPPDREVAMRRGAAGLVALGASAPLWIGAGLRPAVEGVGTHQQLGLPACGWIVGMGLPCPSCGMTTAFSFAARGDLAGAFAAQPMGALLAVLAAMVAVVAAWTALSGSRSWEVIWSLMDRRIGWALAALLGLAWVYKLAAVRLAATATEVAAW